METVGVEYPDLGCQLLICGRGASPFHTCSTPRPGLEDDGWLRVPPHNVGSHELRDTTDVLSSACPLAWEAKLFAQPVDCLLSLVSHQLKKCCKISHSSHDFRLRSSKRIDHPHKVVSNLHNCHGTEMTPLPPAPENLANVDASFFLHGPFAPSRFVLHVPTVTFEHNATALRTTASHLRNTRHELPLFPLISVCLSCSSLVKNSVAKKVRCTMCSLGCLPPCGHRSVLKRPQLRRVPSQCVPENLRGRMPRSKGQGLLDCDQSASSKPWDEALFWMCPHGHGSDANSCSCRSFGALRC